MKQKGKTVKTTEVQVSDTQLTQFTMAPIPNRH
jgi:hypothetical protein